MALKRISQPVTELSTEDLNTVTRTGVYVQPRNRNARTAGNYPVPAAGLLEVHTLGGFIFQRYTAYESNGIFTRSYYNYRDAWEPWTRILTE